VLKECVMASGLDTVVNNLFSSAAFQSMPSFMAQLLGLVNSIFSAINIMASQNLFSLIYLAIILFIVLPFLLKLSDVPASESSYSYMSSLNKNSFTVNFISMLDKSMGYSILRTLLEIPFWFALMGGIYGILTLSLQGELWLIFSPFLLFVFLIIMLDLNITIFNGWAPSVVVFNCCASKALKKGIKAVSRNFLSVLSSFAVVVTIVISLVYLFGIYALIFALPFMALIVAVFGQVLFFESQGMDYYLSPDKIITPRKLENADSIKKVKMII